MRKMVCLGLIAALAGCGNLQDVNDSLKQINATLAGAHTSTLQVGGAGGYHPTIVVAAQKAECDASAFNEGAKLGYVTTWNQYVRDKQTQFRAAQMQSPASAPAAANAALWADKLISPAGLPQASDYTLQVGVTASNCKPNSFHDGMTAGSGAADKDARTLQAREVA